MENQAQQTSQGFEEQPQTCALAIWSLVLGLAVFLCYILAAVPAIICGHIALSKIKKSSGRLKGRGMAIAGTVLGYFGDDRSRSGAGATTHASGNKYHISP